MRQIGMMASMLALLAPCSGMALAADESRFYAGGNIGQASAEWIDMGDLRAAEATRGNYYSNRDDTRGTGFKIYGGYRFNEVVDFRAGYANLGETVVGYGDNNGGYHDFSNKTQTLFADVLTRFPLMEQLSAFTKLGFNLSQSDLGNQHSAGFGLGIQPSQGKDYGFAFAPGLGLAYDITPELGVTAEYEVYANVGKSHSLNGITFPKNDVTLLSLGAYYRF